MTSPTTCSERRLIALHFQERIAPAEETALRAHLPGCAACRAQYERQLLLEKLTQPKRAPADRLAVGLGLSVRTATLKTARGWRSPWLAAGALAAAGLLLWLSPGQRRSNGDDDFAARGGAVAVTSRLDIYRVAGGGKPRPLASGDHIAASDELAFAYRNPRGYRHLLVFGVDEGRNVFWFHPAWTDAQHPPEAIDIVAGTAPRELGEAVKHELTGRSLRVIALFTAAPIAVTVVEDQLRRGVWELPNSQRHETLLQVDR